MPSQPPPHPRSAQNPGQKTDRFIQSRSSEAVNFDSSGLAALFILVTRRECARPNASSSAGEPSSRGLAHSLRKSREIGLGDNRWPHSTHVARFVCAASKQVFGLADLWGLGAGSVPQGALTFPKLRVPNSEADSAGLAGRGTVTATICPYLPHSSLRSSITCRPRHKA